MKRWNFEVEIPVEVIFIVQVRGSSAPAVMYDRHGDPGHPAEFDEEREITGAYINDFDHWDNSDPQRPRMIFRKIEIPMELVDSLRDHVQPIVKREDIDIPEEEEPEREEVFDCPVHGPIGSDGECPKC